MTDLPGICHSFEQLPDRLSADRVDKIRRYPGKRLEVEPAIPKSWMGNREVWILQNAVFIENDVDVQCTGFLRAGPLARMFILDRETHGQ